jgi:predicted metal-dependent hydrolase
MRVSKLSIAHYFDGIKRVGALPMPSLTVRLPKLDLRKLDFPLDWLGRDTLPCQIFNAFSLLFPIGEKYFIDSIRAALPEVEDAELLEDARRFIAQESIHTRLHLEMNERLTALGLSFVIEPMLLWRIRTSEWVSLRSKLAVTMTYEHYTAALGDMLLANPSLLDAAPESLRLLWLWHAAEECEHRGIACDVYRALGGGYIRRIAWFVYISLVFTLDTTAQSLHNMYRSGHLFGLGDWARGLRFLFGRNGVAAWVIPAWFDYFRPKFHPRDRGRGAAGRDWLLGHEGLFAERTG